MSKVTVFIDRFKELTESAPGRAGLDPKQALQQILAEAKEIIDFRGSHWKHTSGAPFTKISEHYTVRDQTELADAMPHDKMDAIVILKFGSNYNAVTLRVLLEDYVPVKVKRSSDPASEATPDVQEPVDA